MSRSVKCHLDYDQFAAVTILVFHAGSGPGLQYFRSLCCGDIIDERLSEISESVKDVSV